MSFREPLSSGSPSGHVTYTADRTRPDAAARAARKLAEAVAAPAVPQVPARPPKVNLTDPTSRVMPIKKGGWDQLYNLQALAGRRQIIMAIGIHDNTNDLGSLHLLLAAGAVNLAAAGIPAAIGKALFDAGYASEANFTAGCDANLYVAVTRESVQAGKSAAGRDPAASQAWQQMAAKLATPAGQALSKQRKAIIEPVFAQLFARFGRTLNYRGDMAPPRSTCGPPSTTRSKPSAPAPAASARPPAGPPWRPHSGRQSRGDTGQPGAQPQNPRY